MFEYDGADDRNLGGDGDVMVRFFILARCSGRGYAYLMNCGRE